MSLISKLFGKNAAEGDALNLITNIAKNVISEAEKAAAQPTAQPAVQQPAKPEAPAAAPSGDSWGPVMPAEENQFSFSGSYDAYFEQIFQTEFPAYRLEKEQPKRRPATIFTFWENDRKALVVELLSETSSAFQIQYHCAKEKIPYLRFYYNHHGWWNTRSYVIKRTRAALEGRS